MSRLILVMAVAALVGATQSTLISDSRPFWRQWLSLVFSRGLYFVLGFLILGCVAITYIRSKFEGNSQLPEKYDGSWSTQGTVIKSLLMPSSDAQQNRTTCIADIFTASSNLDVIKEAEARNNALKKELDQLNRIRLSLEERSGVLEREKAAVEDELEETKLKSALENEDLRKEVAIFQRQLHQLQEEKDMLSREVESASRESRMTDCALKDQALLTERLEAARKEVADLQKGLETLRQERDAALAIAANLTARCQGVTGDTSFVTGKYIKREMERGKKEEQPTVKLMAGSTTDSKIVADSCEAAESCQKEEVKNNGDCSCTAVDTDARTELNEIGDSSASPELDCECPECTKQQIRWNDMIQHQDQYQCSELGLGPVTGSEAFRNFLISSFSED